MRKRLLIPWLAALLVLLPAIACATAQRGPSPPPTLSPEQLAYLEAVSAQATKAARPPTPPGYTFFGWRIDSPIVLCVDPIGGPPLERPLLDEVLDAIGVWRRAADGRIDISLAGACPGIEPVPRDGVNVVGWQPMGDDSVGWARVRELEGSVVEADIVLEPSWWSFSRSKCVLSGTPS